MKLSEALNLVHLRQGACRRRKLFLVCGFQPLHLATFLQGHFAERFQDEAADVQTGLYGDLDRTLSMAAESQAEAAAVVIEWSDLDPRLGCRSSGGWGPSAEDDIVSNCREGCAMLLQKLEDVASKMLIALALPTLSRPLFGHTTGWQLGVAEAELERQVAVFAASAARLANVRVVNASRLAQLSPMAERFDANLEVGAGFPYSLPHASALALQLIHLLYQPNPAKGLITDLDETFWSGIVGEVGAASVSWTLGEHSQIHGLYQQKLKQLSEMGVLLAIASKNDATVVEEALGRADLYIPRDAFYPVITNWKPKSEAVAEVLRAWNVGAESVVYVDDSPMELEEVRNAFPSMTCLQFPGGSPAKVLQLLEQLRDLFGKPALDQNDTLRLNSIRGNARFREAPGRSSAGEFLRNLEGKLTFDVQTNGSNKRLLDLINKTNQFNLNGLRLSEGEWLRFLSAPASFVVSVSYEDRFGPLGVISVAAGKQSGNHLGLSAWVLSCRAFSRKIEHHTLDYLFRRTGAQTVSLSFLQTNRNQPLREFLQEIGIAGDAPGDLTLHKDDFKRSAVDLPHLVQAESSMEWVGTV